MDLKLDSDVVYAILAAIVAIVVIVNITRIIKLKASPARPSYQISEQDSATTATWPVVPPKKASE